MTTVLITRGHARLVAIALLLFTQAASGQRTPVRPGKNYILNINYMTVNDYLVSSNKAFFAAVRANGTFCVGKGQSPATSIGDLWCSPTPAPRSGPYFARQQNDGKFCVYSGSEPDQPTTVEQGEPGTMPVEVEHLSSVWCASAVREAPATSLHFTTLQDDGNLKTYSGQPMAQVAPGQGARQRAEFESNVMVWESGRTSPVTWLPDGKRIVSADRSWDTQSWFYDDRNGRGYKIWLIEPRGAAQKFVFLPDTTIRFASDSTQCVTLDPVMMELPNRDSVSLIMATCNGSYDQMGWQYSPSSRKITKTTHPQGCVVAWDMYAAGWMVPTFLLNRCSDNFFDARDWHLQD